MAERQTERDAWLEEFKEAEGFEGVAREPSPRNPFQKKKTRIRVKMRRVQGHTRVLCLSSEGEQKDPALRQVHVERLVAHLDRLVRCAAEGGQRAEPQRVTEGSDVGAAPAEKLVERPEIVTETRACPFFSIPRSQKRGSWVKIQL